MGKEGNKGIGGRVADVGPEKGTAADEPLLTTLDPSTELQHLIDLPFIRAIRFFARLADLISSMSLANVNLQRSAARRERTLAALQETEERYREIFRRQGAMMLVIDPQSGLILDANCAAQTFYQASRNQLLEKRFWDLGGQGEAAGRRQLADALGREQTDVQMQHRLASGEVRDVALHFCAIPSGGQNLLCCTVTDNTQAKKATQEVERQLFCLRQSEELALLGYFQRNWQTGEGYWSDGFCRLLGLDPGAERSHGEFLDFVHPEDRERTESHVKRSLKQKTRMDVEFRVVQAGGEVVHIHGVGETTYDAQGRPVQTSGTFQDVTGHRLAAASLKEEKEKYRSYVDNAPFGVFISDENGRYLEVNRAACEITGYSEAELVTMGIPDLLPEQARAAGQEHFSRLVQTGRSSGELMFSPKDGPVRHWSVDGVKLSDSRYLGFVGDITDRVRAEEKLKISQRLEAVGQLAGGVAHDFNNLLTVINNYAALAADSLAASDPVRADLEQIRAAGQKAARLTEQLLAFSRKQVMAPRVLNLNTVVRDLDTMLQRLLGEDVEIETILGEPLGAIRADPSHVEQVLVNLAVNARDAMPRGGRLTIETANVEQLAGAEAAPSSSPARWVRLSVTDDGCGMEPAVLERVFEPFFTTKEKDKGTGLGLSTVYGIVKQSGGNIEIASEPGQGTTFNVLLPAVDAQPDPEAQRDRTPVRHRGTETVLVVEDEPSVRRLAERILRNAGYRVLAAANGGEALLICEQHPGRIQLMLTDVVMPRMNGQELAERLARVRPEMKVLFMSGYTGDAILQRGVLDADVHLVDKPFSSAELTRAVREVLDR